MRSEVDTVVINIEAMSSVDPPEDLADQLL
jgi:hypothetical protein